MQRRLGTVLVASTLLVGALAMPATAADEARLSSPTDGSIVDDRVTMLVDVTRAPVSEVAVRLSKDGATQASQTASIPLPCVENCGEGTSSTWGNRTFDPVSGAPFSSLGVCNGEWVIQGRLDQGQWLNLGTVTFSALPPAPSGVRVTEQDGFAEITWKASKAPDIVGYRVERASGSGWVTVAEVNATATEAQDATVSAGTHTYRVIAERPDGFVNGKPAAPCSDAGADLEAVSPTAKVDYGARTPSDPSPTSGEGSGSNGSGSNGSGSNGSGSNGSGSNGSGSNGSGSNGSGSGTNDPDDPATDPDGSGNSQDGSGDGTTDEPSTDPNGNPNGTTSSSSGGRPRTVAPPPAARRQTDNSVSAPALDTEGEEYYYGEGDEFGEIDYGTVDPVTGEPAEIIGYDDEGQPIYRLLAGGLEETSITMLDASKMRAIAMGLLLVVLALHSRRWINSH